MSIYGWPVIAAGRGNGEDIFQILPLVIFALLWVGGLIVKAIQSKSKTQGPQKPAKQQGQMEMDLGGLVRLAKQKYREAKAAQMGQTQAHQPPAARFMQNQPDTKPAAQPAPRPAVTSSQPARQRADAAPVQQGVVPASEPPAADHQVQAPSSYLGDVLSDLSNTDGFRIAVLHYEILGKPVALREVGEFGF